MAIKQLNPYLNFDGTAEKAIRLYENALGARAETVQRFGDIPGMDVPPEHKNRVMHAVLHIGQGTIMISDTQPNSPLAKDSNVHIVMDFDDVKEMNAKFDALA